MIVRRLVGAIHSLVVQCLILHSFRLQGTDFPSTAVGGLCSLPKRALQFVAGLWQLSHLEVKMISVRDICTASLSLS